MDDFPRPSYLLVITFLIWHSLGTSQSDPFREFSYFPVHVIRLTLLMYAVCVHYTSKISQLQVLDERLYINEQNINGNMSFKIVQKHRNYFLGDFETVYNMCILH